MSTESTAAPVSAADLRPVDLFDDIDDAALSEWAAVAEPRSAEPGEVVIPGDEPAPGLWGGRGGAGSRSATRTRRPGLAPFRRSPRRRSRLAWSRSPTRAWR